jgi:hypothetical protein
MARALWKLAEEQDWLFPVMTVHDEIVFGFNLFDHAEAEAQDTVERYMATCPPWVPGLPVAADVKTYGRYQKG